MDVLLISSLLGVAELVLHVASSKVSPQPPTVPPKIKVWPPGPHIFSGDCVMLQCSIQSNMSSGWSYRWFRGTATATATALTPDPRHRVSEDSYSITAVTKEDAGRYQCQAERREENSSSSVTLRSESAVLQVSDSPPPSLTLTPNTRHLFRGERFTVQCPQHRTNSSGWRLSRFPPGRGGGDRCWPLEGAMNTCVFSAGREDSGLYWCEDDGGRSNVVSITVSYGPIILRSPAAPVSVGEDVVLYCQLWTGSHGNVTFFRNGAEMINYSTSPSSSSRVVKMTIENVTQEDEGLYKCATQDGTMESPESWLLVRPAGGNVTSDRTETSTGGSWTWILLSSALVLLFIVPLSVFLHCRYQMCRTVSKQDLAPEELPATKQDVTEVTWDLSWMEMSTLLDSTLYPGT